MTIVLIGLPALTAVYILLVAMRAVALKLTPRPYTIEWANDYLARTARIKKTLVSAMIILALNAFIFLPSLFLVMKNRHTATLFGMVDLLCLLVIYALWRWVEKLIRVVRQHTEYQRYQ